MQDPRFAETLADRLTRIAVGADARPDDLLYRRRRMVSWLTGQLRQHRPWDELVRDWITAEGVTVHSPATNFLRAQDADPVKLAARSTRAFLGIRIDCAQCHDHFFADWTQAQFEGLAAYFARVDEDLTGVFEKPEGEYELEVYGAADDVMPNDEAHEGLLDAAADMAGGASGGMAADAGSAGMGADATSGGGSMTDTDAGPRMRTVTPAVPFGEDLLPADAPTRRQALAAWITHPDNPYFARAIVNRLWSALMGHGFVEPVDELDLHPHPDEEPLLDLLSRDLVEHGFRLERTIRAIVSSRAYALSSALPESIDPDDPAADRAVALWAVGKLAPLRAKTLGAALFQATSFWTYDADRAQLVRMVRFFQLNGFVDRRAEDADAEVVADETLLQRLQLLNGAQFHERTKDDDGFSVARRLQALAPTDLAAVENTFLMALTRRPTPTEAAPFVDRLAACPPEDELARAAVLNDLLWALVNTTEFAWNH